MGNFQPIFLFFQEAMLKQESQLQKASELIKKLNMLLR